LNLVPGLITGSVWAESELLPEGDFSRFVVAQDSGRHLAKIANDAINVTLTCEVDPAVAFCS